MWSFQRIIRLGVSAVVISTIMNYLQAPTESFLSSVLLLTLLCAPSLLNLPLLLLWLLLPMAPPPPQGVSAEVREVAAEGLGELVGLTSEEGLKPFVVTITGPLIRIIGDK